MIPILPSFPHKIHYVLYCDTGPIRDRDENNIYVNADIDFGESGGPLYFEDANDNYIAYGIVSEAATNAQPCPSRKFECLTAEKVYNMLSQLGVKVDFRVKASYMIYLHMDGTGLSNDPRNQESDQVYAGYINNNQDCSSLKMFPISQSASSASRLAASSYPIWNTEECIPANGWIRYH